MDIYLPVAEMSVNIFLILGLGWMLGFLSGIFGVGGGFLMTPLLIFIGIPAAVAVGSGTMQILASSTSGVMAHMRRRSVDFRMGWVLIAGGAIGSTLGILLFRWLQRLGHIDSAIALAYVIFLGIVGTLMLVESLRALLRTRSKAVSRRRKLHRHNLLHALPFKMRFPQSRLYISLLTPLAVGASVGILSAIMGVGGGFLMVPAMIYLIGMATNVVIGTSLFQIAFVTTLITFLHAYTNQAVDMILATLLIAGGVIGVQFGSRLSASLRGEQLRILLAILVLLVCGKMAFDLIATPADVFSLAP